jgi:hypothetical protein
MTSLKCPQYPSGLVSNVFSIHQDYSQLYKKCLSSTSRLINNLFVLQHVYPVLSDHFVHTSKQNKNTSTNQAKTGFEHTIQSYSMSDGLWDDMI